jgi:hypothetical protein
MDLNPRPASYQLLWWGFAVKLNLKSEKALYEDIHLCTSENDIFHRAISARGKFLNIRVRILTLMNEFGLVYGSIDLIIDKIKAISLKM